MGSLLNNLFSPSNLKESQNDVLQFDMALLVSRLVTMQPLTDKAWGYSSLLILVGFVAYNLLTVKLLDSSSITQGKTKSALDSVLKFGTALVVARLLSGESLNDQVWMNQTAYVLLGFVVYDLGVANLVSTNGLSTSSSAALVDTLKFTTMFAVSRLLVGESLSDKQWLLESGGYIAGLVAYDYLLVQ